MFTVNAAKSALEAFRYMAVDHKSCLGIVDDAGVLIGNISLSDLRFLEPEQYGLLLSSVAEFVVVISGKGPTAAEAVAGARVAVRKGQGGQLEVACQHGRRGVG